MREKFRPITNRKKTYQEEKNLSTACRNERLEEQQTTDFLSLNISPFGHLQGKNLWASRKRCKYLTSFCENEAGNSLIPDMEEKERGEFTSNRVE